MLLRKANYLNFKFGNKRANKQLFTGKRSEAFKLKN